MASQISVTYSHTGQPIQTPPQFPAGMPLQPPVQPQLQAVAPADRGLSQDATTRSFEDPQYPGRFYSITTSGPTGTKTLALKTSEWEELLPHFRAASNSSDPSRTVIDLSTSYITRKYADGITSQKVSNGDDYYKHLSSMRSLLFEFKALTIKTDFNGGYSTDPGRKTFAMKASAPYDDQVSRQVFTDLDQAEAFYHTDIHARPNPIYTSPLGLLDRRQGRLAELENHIDDRKNALTYEINVAQQQIDTFPHPNDPQYAPQLKSLENRLKNLKESRAGTEHMKELAQASFLHKPGHSVGPVKILQNAYDAFFILCKSAGVDPTKEPTNAKERAQLQKAADTASLLIPTDIQQGPYDVGNSDLGEHLLYLFYAGGETLKGFAGIDANHPTTIPVSLPVSEGHRAMRRELANFHSRYDSPLPDLDD